MTNKTLKNRSVLFAAIILLGSALAGCSTLLKAAGNLTGHPELTQAGDSMGRAEKEFTEDEKYYTGRTVAATLLTDHTPSTNVKLEGYVGKVGQTIAQGSGKPQLPHGWHFILTQGKAPEAFSCPGGFVLISEGLVKLCSNEDELAAVLAHECSHVALDHPMQAISDANRSAAIGQLASFGLGQVAKNNGDLKGLTSTFDGAVKDIVKSVVRGYDKDKEYEADKSAVTILSELGYDPKALSSILRKMPKGGAIHGDPNARASAADKVVAGLGVKPAVLAARTARFKAAVAN
jgi:predicted Zn-dependent protease